MEHAHRYPDGFPPARGCGHANQKIPLAAHLCSMFFSTVVMFFFSEETFLYNETRSVQDARYENSGILLVLSNELHPRFLVTNVVDGLDQQVLLAL